MTAVIKCMGIAGPFSCADTGRYLKSCNFEALGGRGLTVFTDDLNQAMKFKTKGEAMDYWRTQSKTKPYRFDGKPNRPLTAYHVEITDIEES
jgi:hypothetical protein